MMRHLRRLSAAAFLVALAIGVCSAARAQEVAGVAPRTAAPRFRPLAPGVETEIPAEVDPLETASYHDLIEILAEDPEFAERAWSKGNSPAKKVEFRHQVWALDFFFKPLRFVTVDVPEPEGGVESELVWYMVYRVRNRGQEPVRFVPEFLLESRDTKKVYVDQLVPTAIPLIQDREDRQRKLLNTVQIAGEIPPSTADEDRSVWGVVTWRGIDPRTDFFSVYVAGLTNAYRRTDEPGAFQKGDPIGKGRKLYSRTLQLNFWRPGDRFDPRESEIRFGIPGEVDYAWVYR
jgi:hypothetical protein